MYFFSWFDNITYRGKEQQLLGGTQRLVKACHAEQVLLLETMLSRIQRWMGLLYVSFIVRRQRANSYNSSGWRVNLWGIHQDIVG